MSQCPNILYIPRDLIERSDSKNRCQRSAEKKQLSKCFALIGLILDLEE